MVRSRTDRSRHIALVAEGREALLAGDKPRSQALLKAALRLDARSEEAWLWLSGTYSTPTEIAACLRQVLAINPNNQQAQEGLQWLEAQHGPQPAVLPSTNQAPSIPITPPVSTTTLSNQRLLLLEAALHPFAAGMLLGLLRLVGWLRPSTLVLMRGDAGPIGTGGAIGVALVAALLHGLAMVVVWLVVGYQLHRLRVNDHAGPFDNLMRLGQAWMPGYLWSIALVLAALGLGLSPGPWRTIAIVCWALVLGGAALIGRQLWRILRATALENQPLLIRRTALLAIIAALLGLGLAGIVTAALLR